MIIVNKSGYLYFKNLKFRCAFGMSGIKIKMKEGDGATPKGTFKLIKVFYRSDKIKRIKTSLKKIKIKKKLLYRKKANTTHFLRKKNSNRLRRLSMKLLIDCSDRKKFINLIPYK